MRIESEISPNAIKLDGPSALIAAVPHLVGFTPTKSLVLVVMAGPRSRVVLTIRADLPDGVDTDRLTDLFDPLQRAVGLASGEQVVGVCYPPANSFDSGEVLAGLLKAMKGTNVEIVDFLVVTPTHWRSLVLDPFCAPELLSAGLGLTTPAQAALVLEGRAPLPSRQALVDSFAPLRADDPRMIDCEDIAQAQDLELGALLDLVGPNQPLEKAQMAQVLAGLQATNLRDLLVATVLKSAMADEQGLANHLRGTCERLRPIVQAAPEGAVAPVATVLSVLAWQAGEGAIATCALERALVDEPDYRLAGLVQAALATAMPPWLGREALIGTP